MAELFVSRRAEADLRSIWRDIAFDNPAAADRILQRIDRRMQTLRRFPAIGAARNDIRRGMRMHMTRRETKSTSSLWSTVVGN